MSPLQILINSFHKTATTARKAGTYFEEITICYFSNEPAYRELYKQVQPYAAWAKLEPIDKTDTGIDLVAETHTGELHAIQCKLCAPDYRVQKSDIDSFFAASGKKPFMHSFIVCTTDIWTTQAEEALRDQLPPVTKIDLAALEASAIDWSRFSSDKPHALRPKKSLHPHQQYAVSQVLEGLQKHDRGKLIMACGTGKTFTSLKITEQIAGAGKRILFLVPSLALLSQTLTEWTQETDTPIQCFAVCSDSDVGKRRNKDDDTQTFVHELSYPATTDAPRLALEMEKRHDTRRMSVVFATYHSIDVLHRAQTNHRLPVFDLIVCDEAHRTTGAKFEGEDESYFVRVHDAAYIFGRKRLYMTATPRIFGNSAKATAERENVVLCSMDDDAMYGPALCVLTFSEAVKRGLLVDYKVIVISVDESHVSRRIQNLLKDDNNEIRVDDAARIVGCWKALSKKGLAEGLVGDAAFMQRAVAFCQVIERRSAARVHKVSSKLIAEMFQAVVEAYQETETVDGARAHLRCEVSHIDGSMNASQKEAKIAWLKANPPENTCRILSNVRCLAEGVDVPALDAVLFLTPRSSQVDVVQSVGRVMRNAPGKKRGYIVLPVVIPAGVKFHEALNDNHTYKVVWQVLQALRSHDDRFDAMVNKLELDAKDPSKIEILAITDRIRLRETLRDGVGTGLQCLPSHSSEHEARAELPFEIGEIERPIYARLAQKVGNRHHWENWAADVAKIAQTHIDRITGILDNPANVRERSAFYRFAEELHDDLNGSITSDEIIEMLAQHLVTKPVFDALFAGKSFAVENSMSRAMQGVIDVLHAHHIEKEANTLEAFYESVKLRASGIETAEGKERIVVELYDRFFRNAFPKISERLGIVYTPVEIVDFILKSVDHLLRTEFGQTLGSEGVHILDPFTGTGTFVTRLIQSGLISKEELPQKYAQEFHANEIVLLAYYIAAINIEMAYHGVVGGEYRPFPGICLADTFQLYEGDDPVSRTLVDNSERRMRQKRLNVRVIIGNPPYSVGQGNANDNNQNAKYPLLDGRISDTYAMRTSSVNKSALYDSYVRAIRWASDRIGDKGIVGFVTNAGFTEANTANGLRRCLVEDFSSLYVFHLRGNLRTVGELSRKEGGAVFGTGCRVPVAISLLVKNPQAETRGQIYFHDVGDYLSREEKLQAIAAFGSISGVERSKGWSLVTPDKHGDWLKQRDDSFTRYIVLGSKDRNTSATCVFSTYSLGVATNRDAWVYAPSQRIVADQMTRMINFYNAEAERFDAAHPDLDKRARRHKVDAFIDTNPKQVSWSRTLKNDIAKGARFAFKGTRIVPSLYRPFAKQWLYFDRKLIEVISQMPRLFPTGAKNRIIMVKQRWYGIGYPALLVDVVPDYQPDGGTQCFPMYVHDNEDAKAEPARRYGITDVGLAHFQAAYTNEIITKEDVFYYVYGILHSSDYRRRYADNLGKELPRIPRVRNAADFRAFTRAGRTLGEIHVGFERVPEHPARIEGPAKPTNKQYRVEKMKLGKGKDKTVIHYNDHITVRDIPIEAYEYIVNGKSAIEWVMERQSVTTDKASGIVKDANDWAIETVGDPRYPLSLLLRAITVSLETIRIVDALPKLDILDLDADPRMCQHF